LLYFFFVLGVFGTIFYCCYRQTDQEAYQPSFAGRDYYEHSTCWWIFCGPSYYNGRYYYSPYGYWSPGDIFCLYWLMTPHYYGTCPDCTHCCAANSCHGGSCNSSDYGKDGLIVIAVILIVIIVAFIVVGVIFGVILSFLIINKIMKRHLALLENQANTQKFVVVNLDNPAEVAEADRQEENGELTQLSEIFVQPSIDSSPVNEPLNYPPKSKEFY